MRGLVRGALLVGSIGLALHLVLPQIPGIERSLRLVVGTSHLLVMEAILAEPDMLLYLSLAVEVGDASILVGASYRAVDEV